jgi:hypothetical protein
VVSYSSPSKTKMTILTLVRALPRPFKKHTTKVLAVCISAVMLSVAFAYAAQPVLIPKHKLIISSHRVIHLQKTSVVAPTKAAISSKSITAAIPAMTPSIITQSTPAAAPVTHHATVSNNTSTATVAATSASPGTTVNSLSKSPSTTSPSSTQNVGPGSGQGSSSSPSSSPGKSSGSSTSSSASSSYTSNNWSGYIDSGQSYSGITANWSVPSPGGNGTSTSADATWIGIGGVTTNDLIQIGTENTVTAAGKASSAVFYELLPDSSVYPSALDILPGDSIEASITEQTIGSWLISITDTTANETFSDTISYTSSNSSAEWIEEDPSYSNTRLVPFDDYGTTNFSSATVVSETKTLSLAASGADPVTMMDSNNQTESTPSSIFSDGMGFSVTRTNL